MRSAILDNSLDLDKLTVFQEAESIDGSSTSGRSRVVAPPPLPLKAVLPGDHLALARVKFIWKTVVGFLQIVNDYLPNRYQVYEV